jgi:hypothetical protein
MGSHVIRVLLLGCLGCLAAPVLATEDTDTPGKGRWEINIGVSATRSGSTWEYGLPEGDINYGLGDRMQLVLGSSRVSLHQAGMPTVSGTGRAVAGLKWRLLDQEQAGFALALFPRYEWNPSSGAERRGVVDPGQSLVLPFIFGLRSGETGYFAEFGRSFEKHADREWVRGFKILHPCREDVECRIEVQHELVSPTGHYTTVNAGFKWALNQTYVVVAGIGRDVGRNEGSRRGVLFNLGLQILK